MSFWDFFRARTARPAERYASGFGTLVGGLVFAAAGAALFSALVNLWPIVDRTGAAANRPKDVGVLWGAIELTLTKSTGLIVLAILMGAIGGYIHAATSFVSYLGNRQFKASWGWWYALRAFIGAGLGLLLYVALRAGVLSSGTGSAEINAYGIATVAALAGLFSKQATDKLQEIFDTAFKTGPAAGDDLRDDKLAVPEPKIASISPVTISHGAAAKLTLTGEGFDSGATVEIDGLRHAATLNGSTSLTLDVAAGEYAAGSHKVAVVNSEGKKSEPKSFAVA